MPDPFPPPPAVEPPASVRIDPAAVSRAQIKGPNEIDIEIFVTVNLAKMSEATTLQAMHPEPKLSHEALRLATFVSNPGLGLNNLFVIAAGLAETDYFEPLFGPQWPALLAQANDPTQEAVQIGVAISYNHLRRVVWAKDANYYNLEQSYNEVLIYAEHTLRDVGVVGQLSIINRQLAQMVNCLNGLAGAQFDGETQTPYWHTVLELARQLVPTPIIIKPPQEPAHE